MPRPLHKVVCLVVGACIATACAALVRVDERAVSIVISLQAESGVPLGGVCFVGSLGSGQSQRIVSCGRTNELGVATITMTVPPGNHRVLVVPAPFASCCKEKADLTRFVHVSHDRYMEPWKAVTINDSTASYSLAFSSEPAVTVTGTVSHANGEPVDASVQAAKHFQIVQVNGHSGRFEIKGIPKGRVTDVFVSKGSDRWTTVEVNPPATGSEVDLGVLALAPVEVGFAASIKVVSTSTIAEHVTDMASHVSVVRASNGDVWSFKLDPEGFARPEAGGNQNPKLPVGSYYVVPGWPGGSNYCTSSVVRLVRSGRQSELDAALVPKVVVTSDGQGSVHVDATTTERAVAKIAGYQ